MREGDGPRGEESELGEGQAASINDVERRYRQDDLPITRQVSNVLPKPKVVVVMVVVVVGLVKP